MTLSAQEFESLVHRLARNVPAWLTPRAIAEVGTGTRVAIPGVGPPSKNVRPVLWDEVLQLGDVIQTWSTVESATTLTCPVDRGFGSRDGKSVCGHSFLFVEYVYARAHRLPPTRRGPGP